MARIVNRAFSEAFAENRDALLAVVRAKCRRRGSSLTKAAARLEAEYPDQAVRDRLKSQAKERATRSGSSSTPPGSTRPPINRVRAERLAWAMQDAVAAVNRQDHENPIGSHLKKGTREANALVYVVLAGLVLDPDVEDWLGGVTSLTRCPWNAGEVLKNSTKRSKASVRAGYLDRGAVFRDRGHEALALMTLAASALGWIDMKKLAPSGDATANGGNTLPMRVIAANGGPIPPRSLPDQIDALRDAFRHFYEALDSVTVPTDGGRRVHGMPHAVALSTVTAALHTEISAAETALLEVHGVTMNRMPPGVVLRSSDSPDGPWVEIPESDVRVRAIPLHINGDPAVALLMGVLSDAVVVTAFLAQQWNALQEVRPGGPHQRWTAGDVIPQADLDVLESASKQLALYSRWMESSGSGPKDPPPAAKPNPEPQTTDETPQSPPKTERQARGVREQTAKQQMPEDLTRPASLESASADWFGFDDYRLLLTGIDNGTIMARQISPQRWVFDMSDIPASKRDDAKPRPKT